MIRRSSHIQRHRPRRGPWPLIGCGLLAAALSLILCVGVVVLLPRLPGLAAQAAGLTAAGSIDAAFSAPPAPPIALENATQPEMVTVMLPDFGSQTVTPGVAPFSVAVGTAPDGGQAASVNVNERDLLTLCRERVEMCAVDPRFQNPTVDLRPGGAVIYGDVNLAALGGLNQRLGVAVRMEGSRLDVIGVDIAGTLYTDPPAQLAASIISLEQMATQLLEGLSLQVDGQTFTLNAVYIDETSMTMILR